MKTTPPRGTAPSKSFYRKHPGLVYFLASFLVCIVVLGIGAAVLLHSVYAPTSAQASLPSDDGATASEDASAASSQVSDADTFNLFVVVLDSSGKPAQFSVVRLDQANNRIASLVVPVDLSVSLGGGNIPLSRYYASKGIAATKSALNDLTSIQFDYTLILTQKQFAAAMSKFGSLTCTLPSAASYTDADGNTIGIGAGRHTLSGKQVFSVLDADNYTSQQRYSVQCALLEAFLSQKLTSDYLSDPQKYFGFLGKNSSTFTLDELTSHLDTLKSITSQKGTDFVVNADVNVVQNSASSQPLSTFDAGASSAFYQYFDAQ